MKLEIFIPAYNERSVIKTTVEEVAKELAMLSVEWRIIVADNASTDGTHEVVEAIGHPQITVFRTTKKGKGHALRESMRNSHADIVGFLDADLSVNPSALKEALRLSRESDIVIGSRFHPESQVDRGAYRSGTSKFFNILSKIIVGVDVSDTQCGFKFMNKKGLDIFLETSEPGWFFDLEFLADAKKHNLAIVECPVEWTESRYAERKSKLRIVRDGLGAIHAMFRIRKRLAEKGS